jgi:hypothetical protein
MRSGFPGKVAAQYSPRCIGLFKVLGEVGCWSCEVLSLSTTDLPLG